MIKGERRVFKYRSWGLGKLISRSIKCQVICIVMCVLIVLIEAPFPPDFIDWSSHNSSARRSKYLPPVWRAEWQLKIVTWSEGNVSSNNMTYLQAPNIAGALLSREINRVIRPLIQRRWLIHRSRHSRTPQSITFQVGTSVLAMSRRRRRIR